MSQLPLFPLGLVAFPKELLNLHIFETRYKQLIKECYTDEKTFGITPFKDGAPLHLGTEMQLLEISKVYDDGKMDIKTRGLRTFKLIDFYSKGQDKLYPLGEVEFIEELPSDVSILEFQEVNKLVSKLYELMDFTTAVPEWDANFCIYEIAHKLGLSFEQEVELLKLRKVLPVMQQMKNLKSRIKMNGHFKNVIPPNLED